MTRHTPAQRTDAHAGSAIRAARRDKGLTQEQFGAAIGVSGSMISLRELGGGMPAPRWREDLARVLGVPPEALAVRRAAVRAPEPVADVELAALGCAGNGMSARETAALLGVSVDRVRALVAQGRRRRVCGVAGVGDAA